MQATIRSGMERYGSLLRRSEPRLLIGASALSDLGDWLNIVAVAILSYQLGGGDLLAVGGLLALRKVPGLLLQIPAGALIDRVKGPGLLIASQLVMAVIATSFVLLSAFPHLWLLYVLMVALETANVVAFPAFRTAVARWVPPEQRGAATALLSLEDTLAGLIGPAIGGLLLALSSANAVFIINGATYVLIAIAVARVGMRRRKGVAEMDDATDDELAEAGVVAADAPSGYRMLLRRPDVLGFSLMTVTGTLIFQGAMALFIVRAIDLGFGEEGIGIFYSAIAAGAIIGGLIAGLGSHISRAVLVFIGAMELLNAVDFGLFAVVPIPFLAVAILVVIGITTEFAETPALAYFQNTLPEAVFGRFFSIFMTAFRIGGVIGVLFVPWVGLRIGYSNALLILVVVAGAVAIGYIAFARRWQQPIPADTSSATVGGPVSEVAT